MQIIQKKGNTKNYFVISICEKRNIWISRKNAYENLKKLESILIFLSKDLPVLSNLPFSPTPFSLEKIFDPHPYCQIKVAQSTPTPFFLGGGRGFELSYKIHDYKIMGQLRQLALKQLRECDRMYSGNPKTL